MLGSETVAERSSQSVTQAIYHLAEHPEWLDPLREEMEPILKEEGWTKSAMAKMWKLDSLLRESQRYNGIGLCTSPHAKLLVVC